MDSPARDLSANSCGCVSGCRQSVETLSELPVCIASLGDNQTQQLDRIRAFAVSEIARQNLLTNATKVACERKLEHLQTRLKEVRLTGGRRELSILSRLSLPNL